MNLEIEPDPPQQCGTCKHWAKMPADPANFRDRRGQCRESPPHATTIPHGNGQILLASYPQLPAEFPACSRHAIELVS